ncbi:MAG: hypothetical protein HRU26_09120 [Psychroserpens sp.]|nr:hypothetical protein [Psychroserpens sp.]
MSATLIGFEWNNKQDIKWLTDYFSDAKRQPKSNISIPNIKGMRDEKSRTAFELFFDKLLDGNNDDKKLRKNAISAWRSKSKQLKNYKQVNIELTPNEYEKLIKLKNRRGDKSTIKDTILDLIDNEYQIQDDMLMSLKDKIRKEITQEMKNEIREKLIKEMANKERKTSRQRNTYQIITPENKQPNEETLSAEQANTESLLIEKIDALAKDTNAKFEKLTLLIAELNHKNAPLKEQPLTVNMNKNISDPFFENIDMDMSLFNGKK